MLLFIMMLVSTALMYYYFQRTRSLEKQVVALQNGELLATSPQSGFLGLLGLGEKKDSPKLVAPPRPAPSPDPASAIALQPESAGQDLPPSGAASTPTPKSGNPREELGAVAPSIEITPQALDLEMDEAFVDPNSQIDPITEPVETQDYTSDEPEKERNLDSLYDAQPPVRVRAPQRNNR